MTAFPTITFGPSLTNRKSTRPALSVYAVEPFVASQGNLFEIGAIATWATQFHLVMPRNFVRTRVSLPWYCVPGRPFVPIDSSYTHVFSTPISNLIQRFSRSLPRFTFAVSPTGPHDRWSVCGSSASPPNRASFARDTTTSGDLSQSTGLAPNPIRSERSQNPRLHQSFSEFLLAQLPPMLLGPQHKTIDKTESRAHPRSFRLNRWYGPAML